MQQAVSHAMEVLGEFPKLYETALRKGQLAKLGLEAGIGLQSDPALIDDWLALLQAQAVDFTLAWRHLADAAAGDESALRGLFRDLAPLLAWLSRWQRACQREAAAGGPGEEARAARMRQVNPWIIPRNQRVEEALLAAGEGNLQPFEQLLALLRRPFDPAPGATHYAAPAQIAFTATYQTFCGT